MKNSNKNPVSGSKSKSKNKAGAATGSKDKGYYFGSVKKKAISEFFAAYGGYCTPCSPIS